MPSISGDMRDAVGRLQLEGARWLRYVCTEGNHNKFWRIRYSGNFYETWWGRIGTAGQRKVKEFPSAARCRAAAEKLAADKLMGGYTPDTSTPEVPAHSRPAPIQPARQREVVGNSVAVYAQRDVYQMRDGGARLVHERGHRQLLPSASAAEVVAGSSDYGYWHPDTTPPPAGGLSHLSDAMGAVAAQFAQTSAALSSLTFQPVVQAAVEHERQQVEGQRLRHIARPWSTLGPNDKRLAPIAWHVLVYTDAGQKDLYWRIRFTGRLLETWSGGNRPGSEAGVRAGRLYNREEDVLPEVHDLILDKLRRGYFPQGVEHDDLVVAVAQTDPDVWAVVRVKMAESMKPRGTVALGRFSTIDDEEEIW